MKKTLYSLLALFIQSNVYAQCLEQKNFDVKWNIINDAVFYSIKHKDNTYFSFYHYLHSSNQLYQGIKINYKLDDSFYYMLVSGINDNDEVAYKKIMKTLVGNNNQLSPTIYSPNSSQRYSIPFENKYFLRTKEINSHFNIRNELPRYYEILFNNYLLGNYDLKFYIILFHDPQGKKCSYFESPSINYNITYTYIKFFTEHFNQPNVIIANVPIEDE